MGIISAANLKTWIGPGITDTVDDTTIDFAVNAANQAIVEHCGRTFDKTLTGSASARVYRASSTTRLDVDDFWETSALIVKTDQGDDGTYETTWTINVDFIVEPLNGLRHGQAWPYTQIVAIGGKTFPTSTRRPGVQITAAWGWNGYPPNITTATLIKAARVWKRKDSPDGVLGGFSELGPIRVSNREDPDVVDLCAPFVHPQKAGMVA